MPIRIDRELTIDPFRDPEGFEALMDNELQAVIDASADEEPEQLGVRAWVRRQLRPRH